MNNSLQQICGLCKNLRHLQNSHLMPRALYEITKNLFPQKIGKNQIVMAHNKVSLYTDKQIKQHFLCKDCEEKINNNGENLIIRDVYKGAGKFWLLKIIKNCASLLCSDGQRWIDSKSSDLNTEAYLYFAMSIIWRASAGSFSEIQYYKNALGDKYQEQIRKYLLKEADFPDNIYLVVYVDNDTDARPIMIPPVQEKTPNGYKHSFFIPGIEFLFLIGKNHEEIKTLSKKHHTKIFFVERSFKTSLRFRSICKEVKNTKPKGKLAKEKA